MNGVVVVIGDVMNDVVVRPLGAVEIGSDTDSEIRRSPGGSGANQAAWLARLGVRVRFYGRAGAADVAEHATALRREGVDARLAADTELPTGNIVVFVGRDGERNMFTDRGANVRLCAEDLPGTLDGVAHLHVSGYALFEPATRAAVVALMGTAVRNGVPVSCDPSSESYLRSMGRAIFLEATSTVQTIFPNAAEARFLAHADTDADDGADDDDADDDDEVVAAVLTGQYATVVVKLGREGALVSTRGASPVRVEAATAVGAVDTTGAGDAFCAGYLAACLAGSSAVEAAHAGVRAAADAVGHLGARPDVGGAPGDLLGTNRPVASATDEPPQNRSLPSSPTQFT